jgi:C1A family cysteine protease
MTLNIAVDIRTDLGPVRDQGRRPTCLAFAASDAHRHSRQHKALLCVEWLYYHAIKLAGAGPHDGTTILNTRTVLRSIGQPEETDWPYSSAWPDEARWVVPKPRTSLMTCGSNQCTNGVDVVRNHLDTGTPVIVGVYLSSTFRLPIDWTHIGGEVLLAPNLGEPIDFSDGHAMVVVGHGTYNGNQLVLLRNSWGPRWGSNGHAWVREDYLAPRLAGAFVISKGKDDVL